LAAVTNPRGVTLVTAGPPAHPELATATPGRPHRPKKLDGENAPLAWNEIGMFPTVAVSW
jgi:hypothetical protein